MTLKGFKSGYKPEFLGKLSDCQVIRGLRLRNWELWVTCPRWVDGDRAMRGTFFFLI